MTALSGLRKIFAVVSVVGLSVACTQAVQHSSDINEPVTQGAPPTMRLISQAQYLQTVDAIFGEDIVTKVRFAPVYRTEGLVAIGATTSVMTPGALEPIEESARAIARQVVSSKYREHLFSCKLTSADLRDDECARGFLGNVGRLLYRRPLTQNELEGAVETAGASVGAAGDFYYGLSVALARMLVSRQFLYINETAEPDPERPGKWRLDSYSKASRLSFFLWNAAPDSALLTAAEAGELNTRKGLTRQVERMLASPRLEYGVRAFFSDMLVLEGFNVLAKDPIIYPVFSSKVVSQAQEQLLRTIVNHLLAKNGDYRDLFVTRSTSMTRDLAAVYGLSVPAKLNQWVSYEFPEGSARGGLITQVGFLAKYSHPGRASATQRGRGLRETLLCQRVPDPPPDIDFSLFEDPAGEFRTARERLSAHSTNPVCAGCHKLTDPIGLVMESFDGAGQFRETEGGVELDTSGAFDGVAVSDAVDLGKALRDNPAVISCLVSRLYGYSTARKFDLADREILEYLMIRFGDGGYRFPDFLRTITTSKAFYAVKLPVPDGVKLASHDHQ